MRFAHPEILYALGLIPLFLVFYAVVFYYKARAFARFGNRELLLKLTRTTSFRRQRVKAGLMIAGFACCIVALARPQMGTRTEIVKREGLEIIVAMDVSNSMLAEDVPPNRLQRAKHAVESMLGKFQGDRVGLVVFAGSAFLQCPLTSDYSAVRLLLSGVDTETVSTQGTSITDAMHTAMKAFRESQQEQKIMILLTDGEDHEGKPVEAARDAVDQNIRVYPIGIGTSFGEPIPIKNARGKMSGHKRDETGAVVMSRLDEATLEKIASITGGKYYRSTLEERELDQIYTDISELEKAEFEAKEVTHYEERYQLILLCGLVLLSLEALLTDRIKPSQAWAGRFE